ncbi:hypothetical protein [Olsenella sp. An290]|uniref:hypothetical protein n=1 Tax=Olsenella sp. An290 TaxID=1965625 RepID=UPI000B371C2B|nr:hypothetical protein [Olsenella sp. An290]OUO34547.1 hypothetical protein B5F84_05995 [Olsenella sp. An290]
MAMPTTIDGRAAIQSSLVRAWGLEGYARIQRTVRETDVSSDADFQRFYNRFYRVRRNAEWQSSYYAIMEREKATPSMAFGDVLREMHELTGNVEASFTSKMIATLHPDRPIWDSLVLARLGLRLKGTTAQAKLENAVEVYGKIVSWYETYLATYDAERNIRLFDELLPDYAWLTPVKKVDFLLWSER